MIQSFRIVNNLNQSLTLDIRKPENSGFLVASVTGLSYLQAEISTSEIALFDGSILGNRRVGKRNIVMSLVFYENNRAKLSIEELRHKCYKYFPIKQQVTFHVTTDSGTYKITGYIESNETNIFTKQEGAQISILCPDPYFIKEDEDISDVVSSVVPNFSFPCSFEYDGTPIAGYDNKYDGPFVIVPSYTVNALVELYFSYTYGDITVKRYMMVEEENSGGGVTVTVKGDDSEEEDIPPVEPEGVNFTLYTGPYNIVPKRTDVIIPTALKCLDDTPIMIKEIPIKQQLVRQEGRLDHYITTIGNANE